MTCATDRDQLPDVWPLMDCVESALKELDTAICGTTRSRRAQTRRTPAPAGRPGDHLGTP